MEVPFDTTDNVTLSETVPEVENQGAVTDVLLTEPSEDQVRRELQHEVELLNQELAKIDSRILVHKELKIELFHPPLPPFTKPYQRPFKKRASDVALANGTGTTKKRETKKMRHSIDHDVSSHSKLLEKVERVERERERSPAPTPKVKHLKTKSKPTPEQLYQPVLPAPEWKRRRIAPKIDYDDLVEFCHGVLQELMNHEHAWPFVKPVDIVALNIPDYPDIIKRPMDLGTVKDRLSNGDYTYFKEFVDDVTLVWTNCMMYNGPHLDIHQIARKLSQLFESQIRSKKSLIERNVPLPRTAALSHTLTELQIQQQKLRKQKQQFVKTPKAPKSSGTKRKPAPKESSSKRSEEHGAAEYRRHPKKEELTSSGQTLRAQGGSSSTSTSSTSDSSSGSDSDGKRHKKKPTQEKQPSSGASRSGNHLKTSQQGSKPLSKSLSGDEAASGLKWNDFRKNSRSGNLGASRDGGTTTKRPVAIQPEMDPRRQKSMYDDDRSHNRFGFPRPMGMHENPMMGGYGMHPGQYMGMGVPPHHMSPYGGMPMLPLGMGGMPPHLDPMAMSHMGGMIPPSFNPLNPSLAGGMPPGVPHRLPATLAGRTPFTNPPGAGPPGPGQPPVGVPPPGMGGAAPPGMGQPQGAPQPRTMAGGPPPVYMNPPPATKPKEVTPPPQTTQ